ncbi:MAG: hypothetical protein KY475_23440 [Planctomycetes bacterium]|nr:hypothetical protein [Planctomycetota bacterium]
MFEFTDPAGRNFRNRATVRTVYRQRLQAFYDRFARRPDSGFTWLEAFANLPASRPAKVATVDWLAFPLTAVAAESEIDNDRLQWQDEYVEWRVEKKQGKVVRITFTTEFPEYYEAFAAAGSQALMEAVQYGVRETSPGPSPTVKELFGASANVDVDALSPTARIQHFRNRLAANPWNNGAKDILCLTQQFNTANALFNLAAECGVPQSQGSPEDTCSLVGGACGPNRSSDPRICAAAQQAIRNGIAFSLRDPVGIRIDKLLGVWKQNGTVIDVNDSAANGGVWSISRNGRRAVLSVGAGLTVNDAPLTTGAQVSRVLQVSADLLTARDSDLPDWAMVGNESPTRGPTNLT